MHGPLDSALAGDVLDRLGLDSPTLDVEGLHAVYRAWCGHVPFDNLQKLVGLRMGRRPLPGDDPDEFFRNWLTDGTGGTCWTSSNALFHLLAHLGFDTKRRTAAMLDLPDPNHGTNVVEVDGRRFLVDSSVLSGEPLELTGAPTSTNAGGYDVDLAPDGDTLLMTFPSVADGRMVCRIFAAGSDAEEYSRLHEATREWSVFNDHLHVTRHVDGTVWGLRHRSLIRFGAERTRRELSDDEARDWLRSTGYSAGIVDAAMAAER
jgi:N-hydroxyarylamine O-acetyltransferase